MTKITEHRNLKSKDIDSLSTEAALRVFNAEDQTVAAAVAEMIPVIATVVDECAERMREGGRLVYVGAGTSGRLGILDASEIPPTFGVEPGRVIGVIAGGANAIVSASEGAEDDASAAVKDLNSVALDDIDTVVCISASGDTPYVAAAAEFARNIGCYTAAVTCSSDGRLNELADSSVCVEVGPEVIAGSTRLKAGTAQKMVLNMISTMVMVKLGYTTGNLMTNLSASNAKLRARAVRLLTTECGLSDADSERLISDCGGDLRTAIVSARSGADLATSRDALKESGGVIEKALDILRSGE
ncbi:MAG: N-acetylmuramic acid 6-phosphate etherase [Acidobacteria bacterium]|nr:MAG: N-acetylmuramic acid 6-phosphate etherase [Acidobacteriota bacterium]REK01152.1 MAG: N-acetylmuramic acid 6-phosphate etherase [Acidobacteriota bacterium]REK14108.1 MAG: N-acetylmuramic acid 6-phosphate etherase [Acidobacteriota bacterium]REK44823.1 MAG: N-acetylmuramic acid 6-phosphate etherase [Acidobacteriota bacterium]